MWKQFQRISGWRQATVLVGLCLIVVGLSGLVMVVTRFVPNAYASALASFDVRTIAGVAIIGCLCAAIGYWEQ